MELYLYMVSFHIGIMELRNTPRPRPLYDLDYDMRPLYEWTGAHCISRKDCKQTWHQMPLFLPKLT